MRKTILLRRTQIWVSVLSGTSMLLAGCSAITINDIKPIVQQVNGKCESPQKLLGEPGRGGDEASFRFLLPQAAQIPEEDLRRLDEGPSFPTARTFEEYRSRSETTKQLLPSALRNDAVVDAVFRIMIATSAQAQVASAKSVGIKVPADVESEVNKYATPSKLTHSQLKQFARLITTTQLTPTFVAPDNSRATSAKGDNAFATYFSAYYDGKFIDRLGKSITKPQLAQTISSLGSSSISVPVTFSIPDSDIASAFTILLEFAIDAFDPTPVLGDTPTVTSTTKFYPGASGAPTALTAKVANYKPLSTTCGVTVDTVKLLAQVANAASDKAATLGGLVSQSAGGFGVSLGVFGKISIGDNQTLGTIVKTAASRVALRATYAAAYWTLDSIKPPTSRAGEAPPAVSGPDGYLLFQSN